ncbi:MAG TPA: leucyl/phenylalanyl-tRNA--protein transferase [Terrimicrobiaceae bacterium]|nr:leucyl/phenylalanyl-tRNA--protein transferase [Terrimicrobiaceae bacterium]
MATLITPEELLSLYAAGWFPMAMPDGSIRCFSPDPRGILPIEDFRIPHGARKVLRDRRWEVRQNTSFEQVVRACSNRRETWIDETIIQSYLGLYRAGHAHSLEVWREGMLAGGLYGVQIGGAFFGESMFHHVPGASKVALIVLATRLQTAGFQLLDTQWTTPHLAQFGAISIPRREYLQRLQSAIRTTPHSRLE